MHQLLIVGCKSVEINQKMVGGEEATRPYMAALVNKTRATTKAIDFLAGAVIIVSDKIALTSAHTVGLMEVRFPHHPLFWSLPYSALAKNVRKWLCLRQGRLQTFDKCFLYRPHGLSLFGS